MRLPFYFKQVETDEERKLYRFLYGVASGNDLPEDYLANAIAFLFYVGPRAVAGCVLNTSEMNPLRYLSYLEDAVQQELMNDENLRYDECLEITANFKLKGVTPRQSLIYYWVMLQEAYVTARRLKKNYLMGGSVITAVKTIQQQLMNRVIYHGPVREDIRKAVKQNAALLKIYVIPLNELPRRAMLSLLNRYVIRGVKNNIKKSWMKVVRMVDKSRKEQPTEQRSSSI